MIYNQLVIGVITHPSYGPVSWAIASSSGGDPLSRESLLRDRRLRSLSRHDRGFR